ncbi:hypothetical protein RRG08_042486 [Elysia crispata]|uniref:DDE-1 domain-containing protein n=1 Tax=Elysia crispata TaxID=231223 RepID=A0AAE0YCP0_9GAST|nr:hypothetical protein RRG08_042486 [Elysia crispata]
MPPLCIVKVKTMKSVESMATYLGPPAALWTYQDKGWMENSLGLEWFKDVFLKNCGPTRPQLLLMDSHSSHEVLELLELAQEENIHIFALPPHTTQILQPLDTNVFKPFKSLYNKSCSEFLFSNPSKVIDKQSFPLMLSKAWEVMRDEALIKKAFATTGIFPPNPFAISEDHFLPAQALDRPPPPSAQHLPSPDQPLESPDQPLQSPELPQSPDQPLQSPELPSHDQPLQSSELPQSHDQPHPQAPQPSLSCDQYYPSSLQLHLPPDEPLQHQEENLRPSTIDSALTENLANEVQPATDILTQALELSGIGQMLDLQNPLEDGELFDPNTEWNAAVQNIFSVPTSSPSNQNRRKCNGGSSISSHRLLTSDEIVNQKQEKQREKERAEAEKNKEKESEGGKEKNEPVKEKED